jgi:Transposase IS116/IS110/IS902 family
VSCACHAFAMLAGVAPIEASSGKVVRHRLNRGGDRQLNRALHTIVMIRQRYHRATKTYTTRRTGEGKSQREIRRCLKRTVGRQLFRLLERHAVAQVMAYGRLASRLGRRGGIALLPPSIYPHQADRSARSHTVTERHSGGLQVHHHGRQTLTNPNRP